MDERGKSGVSDGFDCRIVFLLDLNIFGSKDFGYVIISGLSSTFDFQEVGKGIAINVSVILAGEGVKNGLSEVVHNELLAIT